MLYIDWIPQRISLKGWGKIFIDSLTPWLHSFIFSPEAQVWWSSGVTAGKEGELTSLCCRKSFLLPEVLCGI